MSEPSETRRTRSGRRGASDSRPGSRSSMDLGKQFSYVLYAVLSRKCASASPDSADVGLVREELSSGGHTSYARIGVAEWQHHHSGLGSRSRSWKHDADAAGCAPKIVIQNSRASEQSCGVQLVCGCVRTETLIKLSAVLGDLRRWQLRSVIWTRHHTRDVDKPRGPTTGSHFLRNAYDAHVHFIGHSAITSCHESPHTPWL